MGSTSVSAPPKRKYQKEMEEAMAAQMAIIPQMLDFEKQYMGRFQENQLLGLQGQMRNQSQAYMENLPMMQQNAGLYNQAMVPLMQQVGQYGTDAYMNSLGAGAGLMNTMNQQAAYGLAAGSELTGRESAYAQQSARAAMSARGLTGGNQGIAGEVLNSYQMQQAREDRNRLYAQQVLGLNANIANQGYQQYGQNMMQNIAMLNPTQQYSMAGQGMSGMGPQFLNPESQMASDIKGANQANIMAANAATASNNAAMWSAGMNMVGSIGQGKCWVAREVYGLDNYKWLVFRDFVTNEAPAWFENLYMKHGESFAQFIKNKPLIKWFIKQAMDVVVDAKIRNASKSV